jgi:hypothetical protein
MQLTARDCEVIRAVNEHRLLSTEQIEALFFTSRSTAQYRLSRLFQHEFLDRHFLSVVTHAPAKSPALYTLGKRGAQLLVDRFNYDRSRIRLLKRANLGWQTVEHTLKVNDLRVAITLACRAADLTLETWLDEAAFRAQPDYTVVKDKSGRERRKPVFPDGYFAVRSPQGTARFFVEVDRGTELLSRFAPQIAVYEAYVDSGQYQERFEARSLRILVVTTTARRLSSLVRVTQGAGGDRKYHFATFDQISPATVLTGAIWRRLETDGLTALIAEE